MSGLGLGTGSDGSAVLVTNLEGERTLTIQDGTGREVRVVQLDSAGAMLTQTDTTYDAVVTVSGFGDVVETAVENALGHTTRQRTDGAGRTIETVDAGGNVTSYESDANGNRLKVRDPNGVGEDYVYDDRDNRIEAADTQEQAEAVNRQRVYDTANNVLKEIDAQGNETVHAYDARNRRTSATEPDATVLSVTYDDNGNETSRTDREGNVTNFTYDARNLRTATEYAGHDPASQVGDPDYDKRTYTYDAARRPSLSTDQQGDTCTFTHDMADRLVQKDYRTAANSPDGPIADSDTFVYDGAVRITEATSGRYSNTVAFAYDEAGRTASESLTAGGQTYTISHSYDSADRRVSSTYPDGSIVSRTYTARDLLQQVDYDADGSGGNAPVAVATFTYDVGGRETQRDHGNGLSTTRPTAAATICQRLSMWPTKPSSRSATATTSTRT